MPNNTNKKPQKYMAIVEYDGTNYHGMQAQTDETQQDQKTIQGELENALTKFANHKIEIDYAGRTDAGVHALGQVIHFTLPEERQEEKVLMGINFYLHEEQIVVSKVKKVNESFHSRFSAKSRVYRYIVLNRKVRSPIFEGRVWHYPYDINIEKMQQASKLIVGKKMDFASFCNKETGPKVDTNKTIMRIEIRKLGEQIFFEFEAKSFLHNMIRILVGVLLEIGREKLKPEDILKIIETKQRPNITTAPSCGLYFLGVKY